MTKYIIYLHVGDLPPSSVQSYIEKTKEAVGDFFPEGTTLYLPIRSGETHIQALEMPDDK